LSSEGFRFTQHIAELRQRLRVVFLSFLIILILVIFFPVDPITQSQHLEQYLNLQFLNNTLIAAFLHRVVADILPSGWSLIAATGIGEAMEIYFVAAILLTSVLSMPIIAYETYKFIDPALTDKERGLIYPFVLSTSALFTVGVVFGYVVISRFLVLALSPFFTATSTSYLIDSAAFYYVIFLIIGATGVSFTAPVFVYALIRLRVLKPEFFTKNRAIIWFAIWIVTGLFLTPDGGPLLDLVIFIPIVLLVEIAVALARHNLAGSEPESKPNRKPKCAYCGAELGKGNLFCPSCGRSVA
jgi:sec-independent protein translocase protein TatC